VIAFVAVLALSANTARGAAGDLDSSFDLDGRATAGAGYALGRGVVVQADGKIVVGGWDIYAGFLLARFNIDGSPDPSFGTDGVVVPRIGTQARALALQPDGKILVAGSTTVDHAGDEDEDFAIARFEPDGDLDPTFGNGGVAVTDVHVSQNYANAIAVQTDGRIVIVGAAEPTNDYRDNFAVLRYTASGVLDTTFSSDGWLTTGFAAHEEDSAQGVAVQPDGAIVVVGWTRVSGDERFAVARYTSSGKLDKSFSGDGKVTTGGKSDNAYAVAIQGNRRIVVVGDTWDGDQGDFAVVRYRSDGSLDTSFSSDGKLTTSFGHGSGIERCYAVALQPDRRIVAVGTSEQSDFAVVRYDVDGSLDKTFSGDGKLHFDVAGQDDGRAVALQADGKIVIAGTAGINSTNELAVARLMAS
jgi:uncharacterized delta-60 repeat protein